ncbi:MAG: thiamine-phosphate kinase [Phycisphaeraceae bacterium]
MRENELLSYIYRANARLPVGVTIPPGDDMGAVRLADDVDALLTVDQVADGVHVDLATTPIARVARKAIARSVSDIAAMAAEPVACLATVALPRGFTDAAGLYDALREAADAFNCPLIGGDVAVWDHPLLITVTAIARAGSVEPVRRDGARVGDSVYVTGQLGGSLEVIAGYSHHLDFEPRVACARALAADGATRPHAMIDLSDGLGQDLPRLCRASGVAAELDVRTLPAGPAAEQAARRTGKPAWQHAIDDGEDYELLFAAPAGAVPGRVAGVSVTAIGRIVASTGQAVPVQLAWPDGTRVPLEGAGWEHGAALPSADPDPTSGG